MDFKSLLSQLDQLNEATDRSEPGKVKHTAEPGGYGRKDDEDEEGNKVKPASTEKKGRGRPKKATQTSGEDKKYDFSAFGVKAGKDVKLPKWDKKKTTKHSLKEYFDQLESALNEAEQVTIQPAQSNTQVIKQGTKTLGTVTNPQLAAQIKQSIGKGEMNLAGGQIGEGELDEMWGNPYDDDKVDAINAANPPKAAGAGTKPAIPAKHIASAPRQPNTVDHDAYDQFTGRDKVNEKDIGKHNNATTGFDALVKKLTPKYGVEAAKRIAGSQLKKIKEAEMPTHDGDMGAGLGAGRSQATFEGKKPDFLDLDKDGNKKEPMKKAAQDKKKVKEGMNENLLAARLKGKHDGLKGHSHCGKTYEDMEEARCYHEGYKEGLDECYGQMPIAGGSIVGEMGNEVENMASYGARTPELDEVSRGEYMKQQARKPGDTFKAFGQTFRDAEVLEDNPFFESLDKQLNSLLESKEEVAEGMTVSISKGQQGAPDSVSVSAQDGEADQLLSLIKSAGLGLFGGEETNGYGAPQGSTQAPGGIEVVDDHEGMMALMKKLAGGGEEVVTGDYEDEEGHSDEHGHEGHEHGEEESCNECGMAYESCGCDHNDKEVVDEVESEDQQLYNVAEDNPPDSGADNTNADVAGQVGSDEALAKADAGEDEEEGKIYSSPTNEAEDETGEEAGKEEVKERMSESSFFNLYKRLAVLSEESTSEKDDKAEKAGKEVAKDIEHDEGHKGKDDDKAEKAGEKVKKDIEYDDKKDKKEKIDEWANEAGKKGTDASFEADIDFMMNVISGGLNKRKATGQTTIPVVASQLNRTVSHGTTDINESKMLNESVSDWKKLAGI